MSEREYKTFEAIQSANLHNSLAPASLALQYPGYEKRLKSTDNFVVHKGEYIPREAHFNASVGGRDVHATLQQSPVDLGNIPILLSPGFTAGERSFSTLQKELALLGWPSISISHPRFAPSSGKSVEQMHCENDYAVMTKAAHLYGFSAYHLVGYSMGGGDVVLLGEESNQTNCDGVKSVTTFNGMGQIEGDHLRKVARRMAGALVRDVRLVRQLPADEQIHDFSVALNSIVNMLANVPLTFKEARYASSFDVREFYAKLGRDGMHIVQILSENDPVFHPEKVLPHTDEVGFDRRAVLTGKFATHVSGLFMPIETAQIITDNLPEAA